MLNPPLIVVSKTVSPLSLMSTVSVPGCGGSDTGEAVSIVTSAAGSCSICTASGAAAGTGAGVVVGAAASTTVTFLILFGAASKPVFKARVYPARREKIQTHCRQPAYDKLVDPAQSITRPLTVFHIDRYAPRRRNISARKGTLEKERAAWYS